MTQIAHYIAEMITLAHRLLQVLAWRLGLDLTDKQLHFWVFGLAGIILFVATDALFRWLVRWSISAVSFVYAATVLVVIALSLEVQQRITGSGIMDMRDVLAGMWGFLVLFAAYALIRMIILFIQKRFGDSES